MPAAAAPAPDPAPLLSVRNLAVRFRVPGGQITAVDGVSLTVGRGEIVGLVGESGSGKSMTLLALARLVQTETGSVTADEMTFDGRPVLEMGPRHLSDLRGPGMGFIFQNPFNSLNPLLSVGRQISESLVLHLGLSQKAALARTVELLARVGIPDPARRAQDYPHQFSGGMCQRAMIAMALACEPRLILADEPTTALDVTIQAQILELLGGLVRETGTSMILVTHDLGIAAGICDHVHVMYAGQIVESAPVEALFHDARMPYTAGLLASVPRFDRDGAQVLSFIPGRPPDPREFAASCRFAPRCGHAREVCLARAPALSPRGGPAHLARCHATEPGGWLEGRA
jgi:oligopeptide/dipeptide ABC transporter ATP-binding protein